MKIAIVCFKYGIDISDPCCFPLGFMYISAILKKNGHEVTVFNMNLLGDENVSVFDRSGNSKFDVCVLTGFEEFREDIKRYARLCKESGIRTIIGGALATFCPDKMIQHVDAVIIGEGELVIEQALHSGGIIQGIPPSLDSLPFPDYDGFGIDQYNSRHTLPYMGVLTSRGCPFFCNFCAQTCKYQTRSLDNVFAEIDLYKEKHGAEMIVFNDNTLNVSKSRFLAICNEMKGRGLAWSAAIRCDNFDDETARASKDSGCQYFVVGVESFKQSKLDVMNKRLKVDQITKTLDLLHKYNIDYHGNVLFGVPGETVFDVLDEIEAMPKQYKIYPAMVQPFVGTTLGGKDSITPPQREKLSGYFRQIIESGKKYMYPELAHV